MRRYDAEDWANVDITSATMDALQDTSQMTLQEWTQQQADIHEFNRRVAAGLRISQPYVVLLDGVNQVFGPFDSEPDAWEWILDNAEQYAANFRVNIFKLTNPNEEWSR